MSRGSTARAILLLALTWAACSLGHRVAMVKDRRPRGSTPALAVRAELPAGKMEISRGGPALLYDLKLSYCRDHFRALSDFRAGEGRLDVMAEPIPGATRSGGTLREPNWLSLSLAPGVPLDLRLALGEAEARLDLTVLSVTGMTVHGGSGPATILFKAGNPVDLRLLRFIAGAGPVRVEGLGWGRVVSLEFHGGAGEAFLEWSGPGPDEAAAFLDPGAGGLALTFPGDLGVSAEGMGRSLGSPPKGFHEKGTGWVSDNWERAERHLALVIDPGPSPIRFVWKP